MSAWTVSNAHISVLVGALAEYGILPHNSDWQNVGQQLWKENFRNVNYRYGERSRIPRYVLETTEAPLHPVAVLKAIGCYRYQSCECEDWRKSKACKLTDALHVAILECHPELAVRVPARYGAKGTTEPTYALDPVYDSAPWGFEELSQAVAALI